MKRKGVEYTSRARAVLPGFELRFNKKALRDAIPVDIGFANINEHPEGRVEGILYEIVDDCLTKLDESERYPEHYDRIGVTVEVDGVPIASFAYQARPDKIAEGLKPSRNYLNHLLAAVDFLSREYYDALDRSQTYEAGCASCGKVAEIVFIKEDDRFHMICQSCREARLIWGDARGRKLTVAETKAVMQELVLGGQGFDSINDLIRQAIDAKIIDP